MPDLRTFILPSRAYLLSYRDQTLPARRAALADARGYFDEFAGDEGHAAQLALLGLIGEALQMVEDVGVLANALMEGFDGLSFYVKATAYDPSNVNDFYSRAHKREEDYFLRLAGLRFGGVSMTETVGFEPPLDDDDHEAVAAAERATGILLRDQIVSLAGAWEAHRQFFHAYKHGALIANPDDVHLVRNREEVVARVAVWRRRRKRAELGSNANLPLTELAAIADEVAALALEMVDYIVSTRVAIFDRMRFMEDGSVQSVKRAGIPWRFWFHESDMEARHVSRLQTRFGIRFEVTPNREP